MHILVPHKVSYVWDHTVKTQFVGVQAIEVKYTE